MLQKLDKNCKQVEHSRAGEARSQEHVYPSCN